MAPYAVPLYSQKTIELCWEACGRIMWEWRHKNLTAYTKAAGTFLTVSTGLTQKDMDRFYIQLGLQSLPNPKGANLRYALGWSPVIFTDVDKARGHAMVLTGHSGTWYTVVNPCAQMVLDFTGGSDTCTAGIVSLRTTDVEKKVGSYMWYW